MKNFNQILTLLTLIFCSNISYSQAPAIEWQKSLGGNSTDGAYSIQQTTDGGYFTAGFSDSNNGDVTGHHGGTGPDNSDFWAVKLDAAQNIVWQKSLGGSSYDAALSSQQTSDGGFILTGYSGSTDGDVTGHHGLSDFDDFWVVRFSSTGDLVWQKSFGGTNSDVGTSVRQTTDGGFIVAGSAYSNDGDVVGHHGQFNSDFWVLKLNSNGTIKWQKSLGGSLDDGANAIAQTSDGGYIVSGYSDSNDGDVTGHHGATGSEHSDFWVVKLSKKGKLQWQKSLGGDGLDVAYAVAQSTDNGYMIAGKSKSDNGDVTYHHGSTKWNDYWLVKLDVDGNLQWQNSYGGKSDDFPNSVQVTADSGYIIAGASKSNDGDVTGNHGGYDYWIVKTDAIGNIQWQNSLGGSKTDYGYDVKQTSDGGYVAAGSASSKDGDITGNHGAFDFWTLKLASSPIAFANNIKEAESITPSSGIVDLNVFPNPAKDLMTIYFSLEKNAEVEISLNDISGRNIKTIAEANFSEGNHQVELKKENLNAGVYFLQLKTPEGITTKKIIVQ